MALLPAWYFDESKMAGVDFKSIDQVEAFDQKQLSSTPEKEQALVARLGIGSGHTVVDLGAGTGAFAIRAALSGAAVVHAVDISQAMLTYAENKAQQAGVEQIQFHRAGFLTYDHEGNLADFVISKYALHILPDFWKMVAFLQIASILKPGGVFYLRDVIFSFPPSQYEAGINAWIERAAKPEGWTASDYELHVREEHSTFAWIIEGMLTRAGFEVAEANYLSPTAAEYRCIKSGI
ncbi:class I SAM-dependent methyltransferase [Leptolyngbya sp. FACHB-261]|uniref:class I SAM-dependent methyltransferase n=1 Tax=Leptolyngbya sp. FACHB-261 TaxID=2692806 RepID=UPI0016865312|nr:class I SAM-dependent methyltransferase [Leptolyngbya sp. FACHB-261]MBD2099744.1 class I SAM-dependent methyltransferase [Leptolyngbya sp. FACHB-261]